jgi:hypothetical protein
MIACGAIIIFFILLAILAVVIGILYGASRNNIFNFFLWFLIKPIINILTGKKEHGDTCSVSSDCKVFSKHGLVCINSICSCTQTGYYNGATCGE